MEVEKKSAGRAESKDRMRRFGAQADLCEAGSPALDGRHGSVETVLMYHDVLGNGCMTSGFQKPGALQYTLGMEAFERQVESLAGVDNVLFTFDDGGCGAYEVIAPVLERHGRRGVFFVPTAYIGHKCFLTEDQIRQLDRRGHVIGSHSHTHPAIISRMDRAECLEEWTRSRRVLEAIVGHEVNVASVPGGAVSPMVIETMAEAGYTHIYTSEPTTTVRIRAGAAVCGRYSVSRTLRTDSLSAMVGSKARRRMIYCRYMMLCIIKKMLGARYNSVKQTCLRMMTRTNKNDAHTVKSPRADLDISGLCRCKDTPFTVSMSVYGKDNPAHFKQAMRSVYAQTAVPDEIVLVVDGPIGGELSAAVHEMQAEMGDRLTVVCLKENLGHAKARQAGLEKSSNELVALMDADDISVGDRFARQLAVFESRPDVTVVGGLIREFEGEPSNVTGIRAVPQEDCDIKECMKRKSPVNLVTAMMRKSHVMAVGGFVDWYCEEDYNLWIRLALDGRKFHNIQSALVDVRVGNGMYGRRGGWRYFVSEMRIQRLMYDNNIISLPLFAYNAAIRMVVQLLMPVWLRAIVFRVFARQAHDNGA